LGSEGKMLKVIYKFLVSLAFVFSGVSLAADLKPKARSPEDKYIKYQDTLFEDTRGIVILHKSDSSAFESPHYEPDGCGRFIRRLLRTRRNYK
jgi:hypothetical protein